MKIKYEFANEIVEIEVDEDWGNILINLEREEYNINHKETRRHCSLEALNQDETLLPADVDILGDLIEQEDAEHTNRSIREAIQQLSPKQQKLIRQVYFEGRKYVDIAAEEGLDPSGVGKATGRAVKKLKKIFEKVSVF